MITKYVRKLMLLMIQLLILVLLNVQANAHTLTSFSPSLQTLPPIPPPYYSELDNGELYLCLTLGIGHSQKCKTTWPFPDHEYDELCIYDTFIRCLQTISIYEDPIMHQIIEECIETKCTPKLKIKAARSSFECPLCELFIGLLQRACHETLRCHYYAEFLNSSFWIW